MKGGTKSDQKKRCNKRVWVILLALGTMVRIFLIKILMATKTVY